MKKIATLFMIVSFHYASAQHAMDTTNQVKTTSAILLAQMLNKKELRNNMVRIETVSFPPGYSSKKHTHPCPLFVYVVEGELLSEFEGVKKVYKAGGTFYEKANGVHSITQNNSTTNSVKFLVVYLMKEGINTYLPYTN